jgi:hypothetical protein
LVFVPRLGKYDLGARYFDGRCVGLPQILRTPGLGGMMKLEADNGKKTIYSGIQAGGDPAVEWCYSEFLDVLAAQGRSLPAYVQREFEDFLKCGQLEARIPAGAVPGLSHRAAGRLQL